MQRFSSPADVLNCPPRPGEREVRYPTPRDRVMNHPWKEDEHG